MVSGEATGQVERFYYQMALVRAFELRMFELFSTGELSGSTSTWKPRTSWSATAAATGTTSSGQATSKG